ncbi:hypothetical protein DA2_1693 [Desulfovibrio sp. A2]|nr:hypothetical protein DA2_1693 [Desulfovibrio sp. A2]
MPNPHPPRARHWTKPTVRDRWSLLSHAISRRSPMAHKKIERKKELDRRRQRREKRLKQRVREAKAAAKS